MSHKLLFPTYRARERFLVRTLEELHGETPAARIVNVGTGEGDLDRVLARFGARVDALDVHAGDVATARALNADLAHVHYTVQSGERLAFPDATFDLACCSEVIEHVEDPRALLSELRRVLRPGGHLVLTCPSHAFPVTYDPINLLLRRRGWTLPIGAYAFGHAWLPRAVELEAWFASHGFRVERAVRLSHALAGLCELYAPGLAQKLLKGNAANRADADGARRRMTVAPTRHAPPGIAITDLLVRIDERLFARSERSVGLGYVLTRAPVVPNPVSPDATKPEATSSEATSSDSTSSDSTSSGSTSSDSTSSDTVGTR